MITFDYRTDDPVCQYGINHFIKSIGLPVSAVKKTDSGVGIVYGGDNIGIFSINIIQNNEITENAGNICIFNQKYPLFQVPIDTGNSEKTCIAEFKSETEAYPCISGFPNGIVIGFDIFRLTGSILSGYLDTPTKGNINFQECKQTPKKVSPPLVDFYEYILFNLILQGCNEVSIPFIRKSYWPSGKKFAVCLTHDVDEFVKTYQWVTRPLRYAGKGDIRGIKNQMKSFSRKLRGREPYWTFEDIIKKEKSLDVRSTYFFLKESGKKSLLRKESWHLYGRSHSLREPHVIELMQRLSQDGHEIGVHGSTFSYENPELLSSEIKEIEELTGASVTGIRQHRLNLKCPETWTYQSEAGLLYDTSLGYKAGDGVGFRWGTCFPFHPQSTNGLLPLLEIPLALMDVTLQNESVGSGWDICTGIVEQVKTCGGVMTLLWHPAIFNELEFPEIGTWYWKIIQVCKEDDAWITTGRDIASWWQNRESGKFECQWLEDELVVTGDFRNGCSFDLYLPKNRTPYIQSENVTVHKCGLDHYLLNINCEDVVKEIVVGLL